MFHLHTRTQQTCFDYGLLGFLFLLRAKWWFPVVPHQTNAQKQNDTRNTKDMETKLRHTKPPFGIYNMCTTNFLTFVRITINCKYTFTKKYALFHSKCITLYIMLAQYDILYHQGILIIKMKITITYLM